MMSTGILTALLVGAGMAHAAEPDPFALDAQVAALDREGRFDEAEVIARQSLAIRRETLGNRHADVATSLHNLALVLKRKRDYEAAKLLYEESIDIRREVLGPAHQDLALSLNNLAVVLERQGDYGAARPLYEESLQIWRQALGPRHSEVGLILYNVGTVLKQLGDYNGAQTRLEESLDIHREVLPPGHLQLATCLDRLGEVQFELADFPGAQRSWEESLQVRRGTLGDRHADVASVLNDLGRVHRVQRDYARAHELFAESLAIYREVPGNSDALVAPVLNNMGALHLAQGDYARALELYEESLLLTREAALTTPQEVATNLNNVAMVRYELGDYRAARMLLDESLTLSREAHGARHPEVASALGNIAVVLGEQGDYEGAAALMEQSLEMDRETFGDRHAVIASRMGSLAVLQGNLGDHATAEDLHRQVLSIQREVLDPLDPAIANTLNSLAMALDRRGEHAKAFALFEQSLDIRRRSQGSMHPDVAVSLNNLASHLKDRQDYAEARELFDEGLDIWRQTLGPGHPTVAIGLVNLAGLHDAQGQHDRARELRDQALAIQMEGLALLDALSEREALRFLASARPKLDGWLAAFDRPGDEAAAWAHSRRFKGAIAARASAANAMLAVEPEAAAIAAELHRVRRARARLAFADAPAANLVEKTEQLGILAADQERLERELLSSSARFRGADTAPPTQATLCDGLPESAALIDVLRYVDDGEARYLAFVLRQVDCSLTRVDLGPARPLEQAVRAWHDVLRDPRSVSRRRVERGRAVADLVLAPLAEVAAQDTHWLVVPDGLLSTVPLAALPTADGYVLEDRMISYLDRASDVLRPAPLHPATGAFVLGGVDYDVETTVEGGARSFLAPCNGGDFAPLPGTAIEADRVAQRWQRARRKEPLSVLGGAQATESAVALALADKALAHIATHGFFATGACRSALDGGVGHDPMLLSGLVLSGANNTPDPLSPEDGILTAAEVSTLDLSGTELVVLSACETGVGEVWSGQGVLGLRRAFSVAGARALMMSLWSISDAETAALMDRFYRRLLRRKPPTAAEALRDAQLEILEEQRASGDDQLHTWAAFIISG